MTAKAKATTAFVLAIVLLAIKALAPSLATTQVRLLPVNSSMRVTTEQSTATLIDVAAWEKGADANSDCIAEGKPSFSCFAERPLVQGDRTLHSQRTDSRKHTNYVVDDVLWSTNGTELFRAHDEVRLVRHSSFPVDEPVASLRTSSVLPGLSHEIRDEQRHGLQYSFPFATEFRSYEYFDKYSATTNPIDFHDRETIRDVKVYRFHQQLSPVSLSEETLRGSADSFYTPKEIEARGLSASNNVVLNQYYSLTRTLWVEPKTGTIVDVQEIPHIFLAADLVEAAATTTDSPRTMFTASLRWDERTQEENWTRALSGLQVLYWVSVGLLLVTVGSAVLVVIGIYFLRRPRD